MRISLDLERVNSKLDSLREEKELILNILSAKYENIVFTGRIKHYIMDLETHFGELAVI